MKTKTLIIAFLLTAFFAKAQTLKDAIHLSDNEQFDKATDAFNALIQLQPSGGDNYFYAGQHFLKLENPDLAKQTFIKGTEAQPTNPFNFIGLGQCQWLEGKLTDAKSNFDRAILLSASKNATVYLKIAEVYIKSPKKDLGQAMTYLTKAEKLEPKNAEVHILMGDAYQEQSDGAKTIAEYKRAADMDKTSSKAILREGQLYGRAKNYNLAFQLYEEAVKIDPNYAPAYREEGELYYRAKQYDNAKIKYKRYMDLCGHSMRAQIRYAEFLFLAEEYAAALDEVKEIFKTDTSNNVLNRVAAYSYYEKQDYPNGIIAINKLFTRAEKENTKILASDYEYNGKLLYRTNNDSIAVLKFLKAIEMDTSRTDLYGEIANAYLKKKKNAEAITYFEKKITAGKGVNVNDYNGLGKAYYFSKNYLKADTCFAMVIKLQPNIINGYLWRARTNSGLDPETTTGAAKPYYEAFLAHVTDVEKNKKDIIEAYEYLGFYFSKNKDAANAKQAWTKVKELDPKNVKAEKALQAK